jgi:hypothetical protein
MLFAMDEMGQVEKAEFGFRAPEANSCVVSIRTGQAQPLIACLLFTGKGAGSIPPDQARDFAKKILPWVKS